MPRTIISKIEIYPIQIKLNEPFVISKGALTHARNTVIRIYSNEGVYGTGECCPYRSIHGETQTGTVTFAKDLAKALIGQNPFEIRRHIALMDKMIVGNASVKCAFDMALYDLVSKLYDIPLYQYLEGDRTKKIYTDNTVGLLTVDEMTDRAIRFKEMGFPVLKVKLGERPSTKDIVRMEAIRAAVGDQIELRIDANQGWNFHEAKIALTEMAHLNIQHCEEPIRAGHISDQARLNGISPIPIMADETVFNHKDAIEVIQMAAADMFNIKLGKSGGICNAMKLAGIAQAADMYCQVGSFSECRLGISALVHFDMAWDNIIFHDLDSPLMLTEDPVIGGLEYGPGWEVTVPDTPGHGADFDNSFLKRFEKMEIH